MEKGYIMFFLNFWYKIVDSLKSITPVLVIAAASAGIIITLFFSIFCIGKGISYLFFVVPLI
jgi:fructose-specific phosphotransferase system IIC component